MEVAAYLSDKAASVALVGPTEYPFEKCLGPEIGKMCMEVCNHYNCICIYCDPTGKLYSVFIFFKMLEERNVKFYMNSKVTEIRGENGKVTYLLVS